MFVHVPTSASTHCDRAPRNAFVVDHDLKWLHARRAYAFDIGEALAQKRVISADAYLFLYKELVRLCKDRAFCWPGLDWLAERLGTSVGTIKRWLDELVSAELIRRKPRPGGLTTLTTIPALDAYDAGQATAELERPDEPERVPTTTPPTPPSSTPMPRLFFAPEGGITCDPSESASLIRHTVKRQKIKSSVVGCTEQKNQDASPPLIANPVTEVLQAAGLTDPVVINELHQESLAEIQAIIRYVARQRHIDNPPGLIVALARTKAGAALCRASRSRPNGPFQVPPVTPPVIPGAADTHSVDPQISAQIESHLQTHIPLDVWSVWFSEFAVLDITERRMVVGVPNCLARDVVAREYVSVLIDAGIAVLGRRMDVDVVIDTHG